MQKKIFLLIIIGLTFLPILFSPHLVNSTQEASFPTKKTFDTTSPRSNDGLKSPSLSLASEEENIDSFDVNPKSGRWETTESGDTDDQIIDGNLRLITTENTTNQNSEYFMQRGLQKSDSKIEYRYKSTMDNQSQVEYFRDVLGDSADFEEDDEGFTERWGGRGILTSENGLLKYSITTTGFSSVGLDFNTGFLNNILVYDDVVLRVRCNSIVRFSLYKFTTTWIAMGFEEDASDWITKTYTIDKTTTDMYFQYNEQTGEGNFDGDEICYMDYFKTKGDLDFATHVEGQVEDSWDWEDSQEYFYDDFGNVSDFNDGTTEGWTGNGEITNSQNEYLQANRTSALQDFTITKTGLSIDASTYKDLTFEFDNDRPVSLIEIIDGGSNIVCSDNTGWTANVWHLFSCDLSLDVDWTSTETDIAIVFTETGKAVGDITLLNMVYLYDTSLGDLDGWTDDSSDFYEYVKPEGTLLIMFPIDVSSSNANIKTTPSLTINTGDWDYFHIRAKSSRSANFQITRDNTCGIKTFTTVTSFADLTFDASDPANCWNLADNEDVLRIYFDNSTGTSSGVNAGDWFEIDYYLLKTQTEQEQRFTLGFYDQDNNQALANVTQRFFNSTAYRWEIELYDSNQEIASYYYSANQTQEDAGYPAVDSDLFVDAFVNVLSEWDTTGSSPYLSAVDGTNYISSNNEEMLFVDAWTNISDDWREVGTTPYLGAVDSTNYIEADNNSFVQRWFTFADTTFSYTSGYSVQLGIYVISGDGDDDITWGIDTNGDNTSEYTGIIQNPTSGWYNATLLSINTKSLINSARLSLTKNTVNTITNMSIDAARLIVQHNDLVSEWFTFSDTSSNHIDSYTTNLEIYVLEGDGDDDIKWEIDITGDNIPEYSGTISNPTSGWYVVALPDIDLKTEINALRLSLTKTFAGVANTLKIDAAKLSITHATTVDESSCFNAYCRGIITYNILESEFKIEIKSDSNIRIHKVDWTADFTNSGIPALFKHGKAPDFYISNYISFYGSLETWLDFILAPYKEMEWKQTDTPTTSEFITDSPFLSFYNGSVGAPSGDTATYELVVPKLDSVSGKMTVETLFDNDGAIGNDFIFRIYGVYFNNGTRYKLFESKLSVDLDVTGDSSGVNFWANGKTVDDTLTGGIRVDSLFSCSVITERTNLACFFSWYYEYLAESTESKNSSLQVDLTSISSDLSQEFILEISHEYSVGTTSGLSMYLRDFGLIEADIFQDIGNFVGDVVGGILAPFINFLAEIFISIFRFIAGIFQIVGDAIIAGLTVVLQALQTGLEAALTSLGTLLETAIDALQPLLNQIVDAVDGLLSWLSDIVDELVALASGIWDALIDVVSDILDAFIPLFIDIVSGIVDILATGWDLIWTGVLAIIDPSGDITNIVNDTFQFIDDMITGLKNVLDFLGILVPWVVILGIFFVFTLPFIMNQDPRTGRVNTAGALSGVLNNSFRGIKTPDIGLLGFKATLVIPFILILYIVIKLLIAGGTFPDIFAGLPI